MCSFLCHKCIDTSLSWNNLSPQWNVTSAAVNRRFVRLVWETTCLTLSNTTHVDLNIPCKLAQWKTRWLKREGTESVPQRVGAHLILILLHTLPVWLDTEVSLLAFLAYNWNLEEWNYNTSGLPQSYDDPWITLALLCITLLFSLSQWLMLNTLEWSVTLALGTGAGDLVLHNNPSVWRFPSV